jgi:TolB-like protein
MGAVWRAQDTLLGRTVALKTLREITDADPTAFRRLEREARALASINHPNIVTVYSLEEADGQHFLTMEWVEGRPLDEVIPDSGMPLAAFLEMALQIAEAVSVAHACGVIHRDLKPANILVDDRGQVKVLDFGLAKTRRGTGAATSGSSSGDIGGIQGTLHYLAPEQLQENPVDARSDLFSLGVLQYQMLTGIRPFEGRTAIEILSAILLKAPPAIADRRLDLPPALIDLVERCLEKDPGRRIASAKELHDALSDLRGESPRRWQAAPSAAPAPALAVLPLENHTGDPSQDYLADGMTDALITDLARIGSLRVISRTSVLAFRQARRPMSEIAGALGIDAVIEGGVQRSGERLRVTARLIRADTDEHLWSGQFDGDLPDVLDLQSAIAHQIAVEVQARLGRGLISTPGKRRQVDPEVFLLDLQGRHLLTQRTEAAFRLALQRFQEAMRRDPTYAPAFVGLADAFNMLVNYGFLPVEAGLGRARSALQQAAQLGEDNAEIHRVWAHLHWQCEFDWQAAEREYQAGIAFQPDSAILHYWHGVFLGV